MHMQKLSPQLVHPAPSHFDPKAATSAGSYQIIIVEKNGEQGQKIKEKKPVEKPKHYSFQNLLAPTSSFNA